MRGAELEVGGKAALARLGHVRAHLPRDDTRVVAHRVVPAAAGELPCGTLGQVGEAGRVQAPGDGRRRVEHARTRFDELDELLGASLTLGAGSALGAGLTLGPGLALGAGSALGAGLTLGSGLALAASLALASDLALSAGHALLPCCHVSPFIARAAGRCRRLEEVCLRAFYSNAQRWVTGRGIRRSSLALSGFQDARRLFGLGLELPRGRQP